MSLQTKSNDNCQLSSIMSNNQKNSNGRIFESMSKSQFAQKYKVSKQTFMRWLNQAIEKKKVDLLCSPNDERFNIFPPSDVAQIAVALGFWD